MPINTNTELIKVETELIKGTSIIEGMSNTEYHADRKSVSSSMLKIIAKSPAALNHYMINARAPQTDAMRLGSAFHKYCLEHDDFEIEFGVQPKMDLRTKKGKAEKLEFKRMHGHKTIITLDDLHTIQGMRAALLINPSSSRFMAGPGRYELSIFTMDPDTEEATRVRFDKYLDNGWIMDLKSTTDASPIAFAKQVVNFRYHAQAAFYIDNGIWAGLDIKGFIFIAVEKKSPYGVAAYLLDPEGLDRGREIYRRDLALYALCKQNQSWPDYGKNKVNLLTLPRWAFYD